MTTTPNIQITDNFLVMRLTREKIVNGNRVILPEDLQGLHSYSGWRVAVGGNSFTVTAMIAHANNHFYTLIPRGDNLLLVDADKPVKLIK